MGNGLYKMRLQGNMLYEDVFIKTNIPFKIMNIFAINQSFYGFTTSAKSQVEYCNNLFTFVCCVLLNENFSSKAYWEPILPVILIYRVMHACIISKPKFKTIDELNINSKQIFYLLF